MGGKRLPYSPPQSITQCRAAKREGMVEKKGGREAERRYYVYEISGFNFFQRRVGQGFLKTHRLT